MCELSLSFQTINIEGHSFRQTETFQTVVMLKKNTKKRKFHSLRFIESFGPEGRCFETQTKLSQNLKKKKKVSAAKAGFNTSGCIVGYIKFPNRKTNGQFLNVQQFGKQKQKYQIKQSNAVLN